MKTISQNPQRYSISGDGMEWKVSSSPSVTPLVYQFGTPLLNVKPVLEADGIVVRIGDWNLVSPKTLADVMDSENPHYDWVVNGRILDRNIGKTIPIINLDLSGLKAIGEGRIRSNSIAGVNGITYTYNDTETVEGIPNGLLKQINWTLTDSKSKGLDTFSIIDLYSMVAKEEYSIRKLNVETLQTDGRLDKVKFKQFMVSVADRLKVLRKDFNTIKDIFFDGKGVSELKSLTVSKLATTTDSDEDGFSRVRKSTELIDIQPIPLTGG
jgi:hypothetical protein